MADDERPKGPYVPPRLSEEEIERLVLGIVAGHVFTASQAPSDLVPMIFMPLGLGDTEIDWEQVGNVVEWYDKAGERGINGFPIFLSCQIVHKEDWKVIAERAIKTDEAMRAAAGGGS